MIWMVIMLWYYILFIFVLLHPCCNCSGHSISTCMFKFIYTYTVLSTSFCISILNIYIYTHIQYKDVFFCREITLLSILFRVNVGLRFQSWAFWGPGFRYSSRSEAQTVGPSSRFGSVMPWERAIWRRNKSPGFGHLHILGKCFKFQSLKITGWMDEWMHE